MEPLVSISCITYNHGRFLRECLDGFMMQKCTFKFEVLIHDDASTDDTQEIIREYEAKFPDIIKPLFQKENQYSKGVRGIMAKFNFPRARGKYIALCEGDDYWTDPYKLQKQVDFLEANPEYGLSSTRFKIFNQNTDCIDIDWITGLDSPNQLGCEITSDKNLEEWKTMTLTSVFKKKLLEKVPIDSYKYFKDFHLFHFILKQQKGYCQNFFSGIYRINNGGIYSSLSYHNKLIHDEKVFGELIRKLPEDEAIKKFYQARLKQLIEYKINSGKFPMVDFKLIWLLFKYLLNTKKYGETFLIFRRIIRNSFS